MRRTCRILRTLLLSGLVTLSRGGVADTLSELPGTWRERLQPIAEADLSGAEAHFRKLLTEQREQLAQLLSDSNTNPADLAEGYGRLGALMQLNQMDTAAQLSYQNAMQLDPDNLRWVYYAGYHASRLGMHERAIGFYRKARELQPDYAPLMLRMGESWLELSDLPAASSALTQAAEQPGLRAMALYDLAQIDLLQRHHDAAIEKLEEVLSLDPQANQAHYPLARAWRTKGEGAKSREYLASRGNRLPEVDDPLIKELMAMNRRAGHFFSQGLYASQTHDYPTAIEAFAQGLEIEPENTDARVSYARALFLTGETDRAAGELRGVLERSPHHSLALFLNGVLLESEGKPDEAIDYYQQVLEQEPGHYGANFCLANRLFQQEAFTAAASHYQAALDTNPEIPPARLYRLLALKQSGKRDVDIVGPLEQEATSHPEQLILKYALIRLLLFSDEDQVRDRERARVMVNDLVQEAFIPPHIELQALVAAAIGNFEQAVSLQQQVMPGLYWQGERVQQQAQETLAAYQRDELPQVVWYRDDRLLQPPTTDAGLMFREYPSPVPF